MELANRTTEEGIHDLLLIWIRRDHKRIALRAGTGRAHDVVVAFVAQLREHLLAAVAQHGLKAVELLGHQFLISKELGRISHALGGIPCPFLFLHRNPTAVVGRSNVLQDAVHAGADASRSIGHVKVRAQCSRRHNRNQQVIDLVLEPRAGAIGACINAFEVVQRGQTVVQRAQGVAQFDALFLVGLNRRRGLATVLDKRVIGVAQRKAALNSRLHSRVLRIDAVADIRATVLGLDQAQTHAPVFGDRAALLGLLLQQPVVAFEHFQPDCLCILVLRIDIVKRLLQGCRLDLHAHLAFLSGDSSKAARNARKGFGQSHRKRRLALGSKVKPCLGQ